MNSNFLSSLTSTNPRCPGTFQLFAAYITMQLRLFEAYFHLPAPQQYSEDHIPLIKACMQATRRLGSMLLLTDRTSGQMSSSPETAIQLSHTCLRQMLHGQDTMLGPWLPGSNVLHDELKAFSGGHLALASRRAANKQLINACADSHTVLLSCFGVTAAEYENSTFCPRNGNARHQHLSASAR